MAAGGAKDTPRRSAWAWTSAMSCWRRSIWRCRAAASRSFRIPASVGRSPCEVAAAHGSRKGCVKTRQIKVNTAARRARAVECRDHLPSTSRMGERLTVPLPYTCRPHMITVTVTAPTAADSSPPPQ